MIDKKRAQLQKYFFPQTYELRVPTPSPQPGGMQEPLELCVNVKFADSLVDFKFRDKEAPQDSVSIPSEAKIVVMTQLRKSMLSKMVFVVGFYRQPPGRQSVLAVLSGHTAENLQ